MQSMKRVWLAGALALGLGGCGSDEPPAAERAVPPVSETAFGDMAGTIDKARGVETTTQEHKQALDRAMNENEQ